MGEIGREGGREGGNKDKMNAGQKRARGKLNF